MNRARFAPGAILLQFQTLWIITTVLLGDVVTVLAHLARQRNLWTHVLGFACHPQPHISFNDEAPYTSNPYGRCSGGGV